MQTSFKNQSTIVVYWKNGGGIGVKCCTPSEADELREKAVKLRQEFSSFTSEDSWFTGKDLLELTNIKPRVDEAVQRMKSRRIFLEPLIQFGLSNDQLRAAWNAHQDSLTQAF